MSFYCCCIGRDIFKKFQLNPYHGYLNDFDFVSFSFSVEMMGSALNDSIEKKVTLYDHRPILLGEDDYLRVCRIPKIKVGKF